MKRKLRESYWWPNSDKEIEAFCKQCTACQRSDKSTAALPRDKLSLPQASRPGELYSIDIAGPYYTAPMNQRFLVVVMDHFSGYPEILATADVQGVQHRSGPPKKRNNLQVHIICIYLQIIYIKCKKYKCNTKTSSINKFMSTTLIFCVTTSSS